MNDQIDLEDPRVVARVRAKAHQLARTLGSHHDVEDLQQELLLRMCLKSILYDPERSNPWTFITVLLESIAAKLLRHDRAACRDRHRLCSAGLEFLSQADRGVDDATLHLDLLEVIQRLPKHLQVLAERLQHDSPSQVSRDLEIPRSTLYSQIGRIRAVFQDAGLDIYRSAPTEKRSMG